MRQGGRRRRACFQALQQVQMGVIRQRDMPNCVSLFRSPTSSSIKSSSDWPRHKAECKTIRNRLQQGDKLEDIVLSLATSVCQSVILCSRSSSADLPIMPSIPKDKLTVARTLTLDQVWPILALSAQLATMRQDYPPCSNLGRAVRQIRTQPDGSLLLDMGEEHPKGMMGFPVHSQRQWHPTARSDVEISRLWRRIQSNRVVLETNLGLSFALKRFLEERRTGLTWFGKVGCCQWALQVRSDGSPQVSLGTARERYRWPRSRRSHLAVFPSGRWRNALWCGYFTLMSAPS